MIFPIAISLRLRVSRGLPRRAIKRLRGSGRRPPIWRLRPSTFRRAIKRLPGSGQRRSVIGRCQRGALLLSGFAALVATPAFGGPADRFADVEIKAIPVADGISMLEGAGGNIAVSVGPDGVLMVDDQFAPLSERIAAAIDQLGGGLPVFVINTHYHGDHVGGNPFFAGAGTILAQDNVRRRLLGGDAPADGLPTITFRDRLRLFFNGDEVVVAHLPRGHTDGDALVWFKKAGVIHLGDLLFNGRFPYVDLAGGGSVDGLLANLRKVRKQLPEDIRIIPGHGPLAGIAELEEAIAVIRETQAMVRAAVAEGALEELKQRGFGRWEDWGSGFISEQRWIDIIAQSDAAKDG